MPKEKVFKFINGNQESCVYVVVSEEFKDMRWPGRSICMVMWESGEINKLSIHSIGDEDDIEL